MAFEALGLLGADAAPFLAAKFDSNQPAFMRLASLKALGQLGEQRREESVDQANTAQ